MKKDSIKIDVFEDMIIGDDVYFQYEFSIGEKRYRGIESIENTDQINELKLSIAKLIIEMDIEKKINIEETSKLMQAIYFDTVASESGLLFAELEDLEFNGFSIDDVNELEKEVSKYNLDCCIEIGNRADCIITCYADFPCNFIETL